LGVKKGEIVELEISEMAFGGMGLARKDGFVIFVDKTAPLDNVSAQIIKKKKNHAIARLVSIIEPSPLRVKPICAYSGHCGGCKWQFLNYEKQLEYKRQHVIESIEHIGLIHDFTVHPTIPSKLIFGYRNKMEFSCSDRRWLLPDELGKEDVDKGIALGLHVPGTFYKVLDIDRCHLQPDMGNDILNDVRMFIKKSGVDVYGLRTHKGFWRFLMLRYSFAYNQWMVNIITSEENRKIVQPLSDLLAKKYPDIVSVINNITSRKSGVAIGEYEIVLMGAPCIREKIGDFEFEISANSFFQTNTLGAEKLYETVKNYAGLTGKEIVADLYCGTGAIAIYLSDSAKKVIGIEINESSVKDANFNCEINNVTNCSFILGDIKDSLKNITDRLDVMIIDPPRVGMHKDVIGQVFDLCPEKLIYVSCNPATMARDLAMLKEKYDLIEVQPVDMFPHTSHIEAVARLEKKGYVNKII